MAINKKICILGEFAVGKTSLVRRYVLDEFSSEYQATLGVNVYKFGADIADSSGRSTSINQILWDIEGTDDLTNVSDSYLLGASGALIVGDVTRAHTIASMADHARHFQDVVVGRPVVFAFNKTDLVEGDLAGGRERDALMTEFAAVGMETSAATGNSVPQLFQALGRRILEIGT